MKRFDLPIAIAILLGLVLTPLMSPAAQNDITADQFKAMVLLLSRIDGGRTTLVAVQGNKTVEITEFTLMNKIAASGIKTTFYLMNEKTGSKKEVAVYDPTDTGKSLSRSFWRIVCKSAGVCSGCAELFGEDICR